ncbi:MAG: glutamate synthase [Nitrososphaerota archaeon]|nr:glutamate synthase [Nitrososphaerota archaeon]MDG7021876.1 glutamate synthase [Nitrososphaerota archaeon]
MAEYPTYDATYGQPVYKDGCGIFGVIRKSGASKVSNLDTLTGISCIKYRGSEFGAGFALFDPSLSGGGKTHRIKAFVRNQDIAGSIGDQLSANVSSPRDVQLQMPAPRSGFQRFGIWQADVSASDNATLERTIDAINGGLLSDGKIDGRVFSYGRYLDVFKEVGFPLEVAKEYHLDADSRKADAWIAHTRQPTNSPGRYPIWSHPFASMDTAIAHNGDISSFGANLEQLNSWGLRSHVGTDSEVIARLLDHLVRVEGLSLLESATLLTNPFERQFSPEVRRLLIRYRGARLDGPFAVVAGFCDGEDTYLLALTDRSKFRPLLVGEDEGRFYVASEENQIRNLSKDAVVWAPEPGSFFLASVKKGMLEPGTRRKIQPFRSGGGPGGTVPPRDAQAPSAAAVLDASGVGFSEVNEFLRRSHRAGDESVRIENVSGQRYIGIGFSTRQDDGTRRRFRVVLSGYPGNCLANLNDGVSYEVYGNVADDLADTMHAGSVVVHGSARDVAGQTLQGGHIFVRGSVGNRVAIQMREYKQAKPFFIVGETADDYLGEYMAGGVLAVLNLSGSDRPVGKFAATGLVGGTIYIRGEVDPAQLGLPPSPEDVLAYLRAGVTDGKLSKDAFEAVSKLRYPGESDLAPLLPPPLMARVRFLFFTSKYTKPLLSEYRHLNAADLDALGGALESFFHAFNLPQSLLESVLASKFTVLKAGEHKHATRIPPQEVPVEE